MLRLSLLFIMKLKRQRYEKFRSDISLLSVTQDISKMYQKVRTLQFLREMAPLSITTQGCVHGTDLVVGALYKEVKRFFKVNNWLN